MEKNENKEPKSNGENNEMKEKIDVKEINETKEIKEVINENKDQNENKENKDNNKIKIERIGQKEKELLLKIIKDTLVKKLENLEKRNLKENSSLQTTKSNVTKIKGIYI